MLRILQKSETNNFDGVATGEESGFQHTMGSLKVFACSTVDVITRTQQVVGVKKL
jgi:hypothetical protein